VESHSGLVGLDILRAEWVIYPYDVIVYNLAPYIIDIAFSYDLTLRSVKVSLVGSLRADISATPTTS
jgi:hypothetical protein